MWDRRKVIEVCRAYNGMSAGRARQLLWTFDGGNTIATEGCLLTCLAMILYSLHDNWWTPDVLNEFAQRELYYSVSGVAMTTLYADLVGEASDGNVQLIMSANYHPGNPRFEKTFAATCAPIQAYLNLPIPERRQVSVMVKIGTYDDTYASHFVLIDGDNGRADENDIVVLDPYQPLNTNRVWTLSDSCRRFCQDLDVRAAWRVHGVSTLQIAAVWVFARRTLGEQVIGTEFFKSLPGFL